MFNCMDLDWRHFNQATCIGYTEFVFGYDLWMILVCFASVVWVVLLGYRLSVKWLSLQDREIKFKCLIGNREINLADDVKEARHH